MDDWIEDGAALLDIGTGPGLPAWPIACIRPDVRVTALESSEKPLKFLSKHYARICELHEQITDATFKVI